MSAFVYNYFIFCLYFQDNLRIYKFIFTVIATDYFLTLLKINEVKKLKILNFN